MVEENPAKFNRKVLLGSINCIIGTISTKFSVFLSTIHVGLWVKIWKSK